MPSTSDMSETAAHPPSPITGGLPAPLPPWGRKSPCLFTRCQPLCSSYCPGLLYFSRYYTVRFLNVLFFLFAFMYYLCEKYQKPITVQHYIDDCVSWVPQFSLAQFSSVQLLSRVQLFVTPWTAAHQASLSITNSRSLLKLMFIKSVMPSNPLILCRPRLLQPSIFPSIRVFSNESALLIRWPKYWSFSLSISPSNKCSGLISFRMDWLDLLAVQGTLKSLLQHHRSKAAVLRPSAFFIVQLSHPYVSTGKTTALTR